MLPVLKVKRLKEDAFIPQQMSEDAAGYDIAVLDDETFWPNRPTKVHTGIAVSAPKGYHVELHIRSSWGKLGVRLANCTGIVDNDYRGEILLYVINDSNDTYFAKAGTRIAQLMLVKDNKFLIKEVKDLDKTKRGTGGFGSTDKEKETDENGK